MNQIVKKSPEGVYTVNGVLYALEVKGHRISVITGGEILAALDVRSAVPQTLEDNSGAIADAEPILPVLSDVQILQDKAVFTWKNESSLWKKQYTLTCTWLNCIYEVTVEGKGRVDAVQYFSGDMSDPNHGSMYEFSEGFMGATNMNNLHNYRFPASTDFRGYSEELLPPLFCYSFRTEACARQIGFGLVAKRGEHNFHSFDYHVCGNGNPYPWTGFWMETDQAGHVTVDGSWTTPGILVLAGDDPWEILQQYRDYYFASGIARPHSAEPVPRFWHGPILCGYIEQLIHGPVRKEHPMKLARESFYEENVLGKAEKYGLTPRILIIDDKWQTDYANDVADPSKFPDMRGFIDRRHAQNINTLLWFKLWDAEGADPAWCTENQSGERRIDPSNPGYLEILDRSLYRLLSCDPGCYDADGLKIDFGFFNPMGRNVKTCSGKYGVELFYDYLEHIYRRAKEIKPYALMNCSPCHPYFANACDQARIHDYSPQNRNNREELALRMKLYATALPGVLIDTDNAGFNSRRDTMRWLLTQHHYGVPALYSVSPTECCQLEEADFRAVAQMWQEYSKKIDAMYAANERQ